MADGSADFTLRLRNQVTGPARKMSQSIRDLSADLRDKQRFFAKGENEFQKKLKESRRLADTSHRQELRQMQARRAAAQRLASSNARVNERMSQARDVGFQRRQIRQQEAVRRARNEARRAEGLDRPAGGMSPTMAIGAVAGVAAVGAAAIGFMAAKFTSATVAAVDFGQRSKVALASILKDGALAAQQFSEVRREAGGLGLNVVDTVDQFKMLANAGFQVPMARNLVRMSADLQALTGSSESAQFALRAISQIKMKGRLQAEEITGQLAEHGVSADEVYRVLGKTLGKTRQEILAMQKAGDLSADVAIPAILQAVRNQLGVEQSGGFAMKINASSVGGMWRTLKGQVENAFISLGERVGPGITRAFSSIMASIQAAIASPKMQALSTAVVGLFDTVSSLVGKTDFATLLTSAATVLGSELTKAATFIRENGDSLRESFMLFVQSMIVGMQAAVAFFKPFIAFATSDFMKFMLAPSDVGSKSVTEKARASLEGRSPGGPSIAAQAGATAGNKSVNVTFGDFAFHGSASAKPGEHVDQFKEQARKEMLAMLQDM